jgi:hypothetical protein
MEARPGQRPSGRMIEYYGALNSEPVLVRSFYGSGSFAATAPSTPTSSPQANELTEAKSVGAEPHPRSRDGYVLALSSGLSFGSEIAVRQAGAQMWLNFFKGDTVAFAVSRGRLMPAIHLVSFIMTPTMGGLSDSFGRRPMMMFAQVVQLLAFGGILLSNEGSAFALYTMEFLSVCGVYELCRVAVDTIHADVSVAATDCQPAGPVDIQPCCIRRLVWTRQGEVHAVHRSEGAYGTSV